VSSNVVGHVWSIQWSNPRTEPPSGMPRVLAEMFVPVAHPGAGSGGFPPEILAYPKPLGYSVYSAAIVRPLVPLPPERLARIRRQRLVAREQAKHPLFADVFVAERIEQQPDYYAGQGDNTERDAVLAAERERYEYLTAHPNELLTAEVTA
jgi:hypothetical protein